MSEAGSQQLVYISSHSRLLAKNYQNNPATFGVSLNITGFIGRDWYACGIPFEIVLSV